MVLIIFLKNGIVTLLTISFTTICKFCRAGCQASLFLYSRLVTFHKQVNCLKFSIKIAVLVQVHPAAISVELASTVLTAPEAKSHGVVGWLSSWLMKPIIKNIFIIFRLWACIRNLLIDIVPSCSQEQWRWMAFKLIIESGHYAFMVKWSNGNNFVTK